jgi:hypothetical protein
LLSFFADVIFSAFISCFLRRFRAFAIAFSPFRFQITADCRRFSMSLLRQLLISAFADDCFHIFFECHASLSHC